MSFLVDPSCHILLPLGDRTVRVVGVAVGLSVGVDRSAIMIFPYVTHTQPPMVDTVVTLIEVVVKHSVKKILTCKAVTVNHCNSTLAVLDLLVGVAAEADAVFVEPFDLSQKASEIVSHQTSVEGLVEVDTIATGDNLVELLHCVVAGGKNIVIHEDNFLASLDGYLVNIHIGTDSALFTRNHTPGTMVRAATGKEAVSRIFWDTGVDRIVGLDAVDFVRQLARYVVASTALDDFAGIIAGDVIRGEIEDFRHINPIVMKERNSPLYTVAMHFVPAGNLA